MKESIVRTYFVFSCIIALLTICSFWACSNNTNNNNGNNGRPAGVGTDSKLHKYEYHYMSAYYAMINNVYTLVDMRLDDVDFDNVASAAWDKCNITLDFKQNTNGGEETHTTINTNTGSETDIHSALTTYRLNHYNSLNPGYLMGIDDCTNLPDLNGVMRVGLSSTSPRMSFILVGKMYHITGSNYLIQTKRLVTAHELGHQIGIPESGHTNHNGTGNECCLMHAFAPYTGCQLSDCFFCDGHAVELWGYPAS